MFLNESRRFTFHWNCFFPPSIASHWADTSVLSISARFSRLKNIKELQQETEQDLVQASRAQWSYGYEIQHFLCKAFSEEWQCQAPTIPHYFHRCLEWARPGCSAHIRGHSLQSILRGDRSRTGGEEQDRRRTGVIVSHCPGVTGTNGLKIELRKWQVLILSCKHKHIRVGLRPR